MRRLFTSFPGGVAGSALLLLRAVSGLLFVREGFSFFRQVDASASTLVAGLVVVGTLLVIGLMTPLSGGAGALIVGAVAAGFVEAPVTAVFQPGVSALLLESMLIALLLQGPGAYSVDARLFGRREIIIPLRWE
ncbi:MAG: hypothetical protein JST93_14945 [Acidobacteria bacterium]|nr:hypothetical protein [Acidobacteriota bacterium]